MTDDQAILAAVHAEMAKRHGEAVLGHYTREDHVTTVSRAGDCVTVTQQAVWEEEPDFVRLRGTEAGAVRDALPGPVGLVAALERAQADIQANRDGYGEHTQALIDTVLQLLNDLVRRINGLDPMAHAYGLLGTASALLAIATSINERHDPSVRGRCRSGKWSVLGRDLADESGELPALPGDVADLEEWRNEAV